MDTPKTAAGLRGAINSKTDALTREELLTEMWATKPGAFYRGIHAASVERARVLREEIAALEVTLGSLDTGRCGARCRTRGGAPCNAPRVKGKGRCKLHGGLSTGPTTDAGRARAREALARVNARRREVVTGSAQASL